MRKWFLAAVAVITAAVLADAQETRDIRTDVYLLHNGNAVVYQEWDVTVTSGTEWYIPIDNLGDRSIEDFTVFENDEEYASDGRHWNSDRSLKAKTRRSGIIDKGKRGVELCWGQGEYGDHVYGIIYTIRHLVQRMADGENNAFIWQFLNDEWSVKPQHAILRIYNEADSTVVWKAGQEGNMGVWVFGCEADVRMEDGVVVVESTEPFRYESSMIVMMRFDEDLFEPISDSKRTFEEMKESAFEGSDYELNPSSSNDDGESLFEKIIEWGLVIIIFLGIPILFLLYLLWYLWVKITGRRYRKDILGVSKITDWSRQVPMGGSLLATYSLIARGDMLSNEKTDFARLVGAYFLKWVQDGIIKVEKDPKKESRVNLNFSAVEAEDLETTDSMEKKIYAAAKKAAGRNLILEADEFKDWSEVHYKEVTSWPSSAKALGTQMWPSSKIERQEAIQFKNFLNDFTLSDEREVPEVGVWKQYLIFAQLFGVADRVAKNFEKLFPNMYQEYAEKTNMLDTATTYTILRNIRTSSTSMMSSALSKKAQAEAAASSSSRSYGGGGHSSFGGGGGFSGGGHGGGSR